MGLFIAASYADRHNILPRKGSCPIQWTANAPWPSVQNMSIEVERAPGAVSCVQPDLANRANLCEVLQGVTKDNDHMLLHNDQDFDPCEHVLGLAVLRQ